MNYKTSKPAKVLILLGVLKGYIKNPVLFFVGMIATLGKFKKNISDEFPEDFVEANAMIAWFYVRLKRKLSQKQAFEITRAAIMTAGFAVQQAGVRCVEDERTFENLVKNQQLMHEHGTTKANTMEIIEQNDKIYRFKVTRCLFMEFFSSVGVPELTSIFCSLDNAVFSSYLPDKVVFYRGGINRRIVDGAKECSFVIENKAL